MAVAGSLLAAVLFVDFAPVSAQGPLTYPEIIAALQTKVPNRSFQTKAAQIAFVIAQIKKRKLDKPLTKDREDDLRQAGATEELIQTIRANSPRLTAPTPEPEAEPVDLGDLTQRAVNLVKPEYTPEARQARTTGEVKLVLVLDETGRVISVTRLTVVENGLTERAIEAARQSTFRPAMRDGKPARGTGTVKYNFKFNSFDTPTVLAAANAFRDNRDCDRAMVEYNRILEVDPKHAKALLGRATCHIIETNYSLAAADLSNATAAEKQDFDIYFFLGVALDFKGDPLAAAENYEKALKLRPRLDNRPVFDCLYIDRRGLSPDETKATANSIISACNQSYRNAAPELQPMLSYKRGIAYRMKGDFDKAIDEFENLRRSNPQFSAVNTQLQIAFNTRGLQAFDKKEYKKAFDDVSQAIQADPQSPTPYINRCAIYLYAWKQYAEAVNDCTSAIKLATRSSMAYNHRGYAYEMLGSRREAVADYKKALDLDPRNDTARGNLSRLEQGRPSMKN